MRQNDHSFLRYILAPDDEASAAIGETFEAYARMIALLGELPAEEAVNNLVALHERAYELIRDEIRLPARLVTLGLRDFTAHRGAAPDDAAERGLPLDEKLFAIKSASSLTVATMQGRVTVSYAVAGYQPDWEGLFPARLIRRAGRYEIHIGVRPNDMQMSDASLGASSVSFRTEEKAMSNEGVLSRMGRLIAGIANATIDKVEDGNKVAVVEQAIREIDTAAEEARADLGKAKAEEFRIRSRRGEIEAERATLDEKIRLAVASGRDDLAKAAIARQIDLEAQVTALDKLLADVATDVAEGQQALQAVHATRREAEARLSELKRSLAHEAPATAGFAPAKRSATDEAARAAAAVARVTGVPGGAPASGPELDELDRLHREQAIAERLQRFKQDN